MEWLDNLPFVDQIPLEARVFIVQVVAAIALIAILWLLRQRITRLLLRPIEQFVSKTQGDADDMLVTWFQHAVNYLVLGAGITLGGALSALTACGANC
jgi:hypothetical protein